jgi:hypothetical protein
LPLTFDFFAALGRVTELRTITTDEGLDAMILLGAVNQIARVIGWRVIFTRLVIEIAQHQRRVMVEMDLLVAESALEHESKPLSAGWKAGRREHIDGLAAFL